MALGGFTTETHPPCVYVCVIHGLTYVRASITDVWKSSHGGPQIGAVGKLEETCESADVFQTHV